MAIEIRELGPTDEWDYAELLANCGHAMIYHSLKYRSFLKTFLPDSAQDHYLLAFEDGVLTGALPTFLQDGPAGAVLNSLPFFGSHGSILPGPNFTPQAGIGLVGAMMDLCAARRASFATVIDTPFASHEDLFRKGLAYQYADERIGQVTFLPVVDENSQVDEALLSLYHQKTRNIVRKSLKTGLTFSHDASEETLGELLRLHETSMARVGGIAKPPRFFSTIASHFQYDDDYRIYTARSDSGKIVCALLVLYYADIVEYFVPAIDDDWRTYQPLSALIHLSMLDAVIERSARRWNWGGTWLSQRGVYHFKARWGTKDFPYRYYTRVFSGPERLRGLSRQVLLAGYPWFYTVPFCLLD